MTDAAQTVEQPYPRCSLAPLDAIAGAKAKLSNDWGDYGYRMGYEGQTGTTDRPYLFACTCSDGSYFYIASDRWGNADQVVWNGSEWIWSTP